MLSTIGSAPIYLATWFADHPVFFLGYAVAVIFPCPVLSAFILDTWRKLGPAIKSWFVGIITRTTPTPPPPASPAT